MTADDGDEVAYAKGSATEDQLRETLSEFFADLDDEQVRHDAEEAGVDLDELRAAGSGAVSVRSDSAKMTGAEIIVIELAIHAGKKVIDEVIAPWLRRRLAKDALGERQGG